MQYSVRKADVHTCAPPGHAVPRDSNTPWLSVTSGIGTAAAKEVTKTNTSACPNFVAKSIDGTDLLSTAARIFNTREILLLTCGDNPYGRSQITIYIITYPLDGEYSSAKVWRKATLSLGNQGFLWFNCSAAISVPPMSQLWGRTEWQFSQRYGWKKVKPLKHRLNLDEKPTCSSPPRLDENGIPNQARSIDIK